MSKVNSNKYKEYYNNYSKSKKDPPVRRKKHGCLCCFTSVIICLVLVVGGLFGAAYYFYGKYAEPITEMSFGEAFRVMTGLYKNDKSKIVTNPYDPVADKQEFYNNFKAALMLEIDELSIVDIIKGQLNPPENPSTDVNSTGNAYLDRILQEAKFDFSSLNTDSLARIFAITDKQLAAVINEMFELVDEIPSLSEAQSSFGAPFNNLIKVEQVIIRNSDLPENVALDLTLSLNLKLTVKTFLNQNTGIPRWLVNILPSFVPDYLYLTSTIYPNTSNSPTFELNAINKELMSKVFKAADNIIAKSTGEENKITDTMQKVGEVVHQTLGKIAGYFGDGNFGFVDTTLSIDPIQGLMNLMNIDLSASQFLQTIKYIQNIDLQANPDAYINGFIPNPSTEQDFRDNMAILSKAYGITDMADWSKSAFIENINKIPEMIDIANKTDENGRYLYEKSQDELADLSRISDKAIAQLLQEMTDKFSLDENGEKRLPFALTILDMNILADNNSDVIRLVAQIDIKGFIADTLGNNIFNNLITSLFPDYMILRAETPIEKLTDKNVSSTIDMNFIGAIDTQTMFDTLSRIVAPYLGENILKYFDIEYLAAEIDKIIYETLGKYIGENSEYNGMKLGVVYGVNCLQLPTVYDLVNNISKAERTPDEIQRALSGFYSKQGHLDSNGNVINRLADVLLDGQGNFIERELEEKLFLLNPEIIDENSNVTKRYNENNLYSSMLNIGDDIKNNISDFINIRDLASTKESMDKLRLNMLGEELGKLLITSGKLDILSNSFAYYKNYELIDSLISKKNESYFLNLKIHGIINLEAFNTENIKLSIEGLMPQDIFINAKINLIPNINGDFDINISLNNTDDSDISVILSIINGINISDKKFTTEDIINPLNSKLKDLFVELDNKGFSISPEEDETGKVYLKSNNIFELLVKIGNLDEGDNKLNSMEVRSVMQGLLQEGVTSTQLEGKNLDRVIDNELSQKFFFKIGGSDGLNRDDLITDLKRIGSMYTTAIDYDKLRNCEETDINNLRLKLFDYELALLIKNDIEDNTTIKLPAYIGSLTVTGIITRADGTLSIQISAPVHKNTGSDTDKKIAALLPDNIIINTVIDTNNFDVDNKYITYSTLNLLDATSMNNLNIVASKFFVNFDTEILNDIIADSFTNFMKIMKDNGMTLTINENTIAGNSIFGIIKETNNFNNDNPLKNPSEEDIMNVFLRIGKLPSDGIEDNIGNVDFNRFYTEELETKMFMNIADKSISPELFLKGIDINTMTNLNYSLMKSAAGNIDDYNIFIRAEEIGKLISNKMHGLLNLPDYIDTPQILNFTVKDGKINLTLISNVQKELNGDIVTKLLPDSLYFFIDIDFLSLSQSGGNGTISINALDSHDIDTLFNILELSKSATITSQETIIDNISVTLFNTLTNVNISGISLEFINGDNNNINGGLKGKSIYYLIARGTSDIYNEGDDELLKEIIYDINNSESGFLSKPYETENNGPSISNAIVSDMYIFNQIGQEIETDGHIYDIMQLAILQNNGINANAYLQGFTNNYDRIIGDFITVTIKITPDTLIPTTTLGILKELVPTEMYISIFVNKTANENTIILVNDLSDKKAEYLEKISSMDIGGVADKITNTFLSKEINVVHSYLSIGQLLNSAELVDSYDATIPYKGVGYMAFNMI